MAYSVCMQPWIRIRGIQNNTVKQSEADWLDLAAFQGVAIHVVVLGFLGPPSLSLESAPTREEVFFRPIGAPGVGKGDSTFAVATLGAQAVKVFDFSSPNPMSRYVRWSITSTTADWNLTFKIWLTLFQGRGA